MEIRTDPVPAVPEDNEEKAADESLLLFACIQMYTKNMEENWILLMKTKK